MAQVDRPILPPLLYRYRGIRNQHELHQELDAIEQEYLWCSDYRSLNDPMEGFYEPASRLQKNSAYTRIARDILNAKRGIGICCFSDTHSNELMWTHYASNYSGLCVGYRTQELIEGLPEVVHLVRLAYDGAPPRLAESNAMDAQDAAIRILSHKKSNWIYEREWRVLGQLHGRLNIAAKGCVRALYLGARMPERMRDAIVERLKGDVIRISTMKVTDYEHTWKRVKALK